MSGVRRYPRPSGAGAGWLTSPGALSAVSAVIRDLEKRVDTFGEYVLDPEKPDCMVERRCDSGRPAGLLTRSLKTGPFWSGAERPRDCRPEGRGHEEKLRPAA